MKLVRQAKIHYLQPAWADGSSVQAGFTTRNGGVSRPPYNSLNLGFNTEDPSYNVEGNRSSLARAFDMQPHLMLTVKQVHGTDILLVNDQNPDLSHFQGVECDAIITDQPGIMIGVLVADCYPVLIFDPRKKVAAVVHVGWKGAAAGLLAKTVQAMAANFESRPEQLVAAVGPGIGAHKYEVDRPVRDAFRQGAGNWERVAKEVELGKWHLDLQKACQLQLEEAGLDSGQVNVVEQCTCCHRELFFSYRRDEGKTGRQLGFVLLK